MTTAKNLHLDSERFRTKAANLADSYGYDDDALVKVAPAIEALSTLALATQNAAMRQSRVELNEQINADR